MRLTFTLLLLCSTILGFAQGQTSEFWVDIQNEARMIEPEAQRYITPKHYRPLFLEVEAMRNFLMRAPMQNTPEAAAQVTVIELPMPDGTWQRFDIYQAPIMEDALAEQFPEIKTYAGFGIDDRSAYLRFDLTPQGFHAMILSDEHSTVFIDPIFHLRTSYYQSYFKKDYDNPLKRMECHVGELELDPLTEGVDESHVELKSMFGDCNYREYRLALACTGEYAQFHGGTVALALAAQVTTMNRVNGVYEREVSVHMNIIGNNNLIIYTVANSDPYTNNNGGTMLGENQTNLTNVIGGANYDIGHVFSTGGGGIASLGSVCVSNRKAQGVTGSPAPVADAFDIDYVAHEMGHQFGGNHTFNSTQGACGGGNINNATAYETGSGSTIMAYAGICAPANVQNNSDDYFHYVSLQEISTFIVSGSGANCDALTATPNNPPVLVAPPPTYTIPISTPFFLTADASDPDGDPISYCWEQYNNQVTTQPPVATATGGPNFRTWDPTTSPTRYFPRLSALAANGPFTWEVLPSVARTMNFRVTVRDNAPSGGGCTDEGSAAVTFNANAGPFTVTYPNATGITWPSGSQQTVTWNVANTDAAPVSCANVDILLSINGGQTYPIVLATNVPNNGSYQITVPNNISNTCRIMVVCSSSIFFDISNNNFAITAPLNDFTLGVTPASQTSCGVNSLDYTVNIGSNGGFNQPVNLSVAGVPAGATSSFTVNPVIPVGTSTLNVTNLNNAAAGSYTLTISATSVTGTKTATVTLVVAAGAPAAATLVTPADAATGVALAPTLTWTALPGAGTYEVQVATDQNFANIVASQTGIVGTSYTVAPALNANVQYFWRVRGVNGCGNGNYAAEFDFTTVNITCTTVASTNVPVTISPTGTPTITSNLTFNGAGSITDVNVSNLVGTHSWINDLRVRVASPTGTSVTLWDQICDNENDWNVKFDDQAANPNGNLPCPPTDGLYYQPNTVLSGFNGQDPNGVWVLTIDDLANQDGGSLTAWSLTVCYTPAQQACIMTAAATPTATTCGLCNGAVTVTPTAGTAPYTYAWNNGGTTQTVTGLCAGAFTVTVTDNAGCTATVSSNVGQSQGIASSVATTADNGTNNGTATATVTGGAGPYTYAWSNGGTTATLTGLGAGFYTVTVTSANGCTSTATAEVVLVIGVGPSISNLASFYVAPNPSNGIFNIFLNFTNNEEFVLDIYADNGQLVQRIIDNGQNLQMPVDLSPYADGLYMLMLRTRDGYTTKKISVLR